ncbi:hypothetical protein H0E87_022552, partial [Populus deltoides]
SFIGLARILKSEHQQYSFNSLQKLEGVRKGQTVEGLVELKQYLKRFGYYPSDVNLMASDFDDLLESALKTHQNYFHLNVTGILDDSTIKQMMIPRCGMPHITPNNTKSKHTKFHMEASDAASANIVIAFYSGDHGDAHASSPEGGRLHFDADEKWSANPAMDQIDLESVAVHEIGHLLGLDHSSDSNAVMYSKIPPGTVKRDLAQDDIDGIHALYGN